MNNINSIDSVFALTEEFELPTLNQESKILTEDFIREVLIII
jgi:hypothetical protein